MSLIKDLQSQFFLQLWKHVAVWSVEPQMKQLLCFHVVPNICVLKHKNPAHGLKITHLSRSVFVPKSLLP